MAVTRALLFHPQPFTAVSGLLPAGCVLSITENLGSEDSTQSRRDLLSMAISEVLRENISVGVAGVGFSVNEAVAELRRCPTTRLWCRAIR